ncbi:unnamed protein product [Microthlaspi erraticum]|uniref:Uncharacterized protein n=1 Tax=Microthlaspi erraticum TaxID=1685480 RepID=A0A6D2KCV9_9BRAS|nr:unnamed protein product [Microthlaspi erraticum]
MSNASLIIDGVRELDQWWNKLLKYGEVVLSSVKQDDSSKYGVSDLDQWCDELPNYSVKQYYSPKAENESQEECKEGVKVDRVGEAFKVVEETTELSSQAVTATTSSCRYLFGMQIS